MDFLTLKAMEEMEWLVHGFGMRPGGGEVVSRQDWRGKVIPDGERPLPLGSLRQVLGDEVVVCNPGLIPELLWEEEGDGLIADARGYAWGVFTADCLPIILIDPARRVAGVVHAGWRGTASGVLQRALEKMKVVFGCKGQEIIAAMGPCIRPCCLEVDEPVKKTFSEGSVPWGIASSPRGAGKWSLDLQAANAWQLVQAGLKPENIHRLETCTCCKRELFYSYRADKTKGRQLSYIGLKSDG